VFTCSTPRRFWRLPAARGAQEARRLALEALNKGLSPARGGKIVLRVADE
jgi:hypothetical protein